MRTCQLYVQTTSITKAAITLQLSIDTERGAHTVSSDQTVHQATYTARPPATKQAVSSLSWIVLKERGVEWG